MHVALEQQPEALAAEADRSHGAAQERIEPPARQGEQVFGSAPSPACGRPGASSTDASLGDVQPVLVWFPVGGAENRVLDRLNGNLVSGMQRALRFQRHHCAFGLHMDGRPVLAGNTARALRRALQCLCGGLGEFAFRLCFRFHGPSSTSLGSSAELSYTAHAAASAQ